LQQNLLLKKTADELFTMTVFITDKNQGLFQTPLR